MSETGRPTALLITSNGAGMGHLARMTAVAMAVNERVDPILVSMSSALPIVLGATGLRGEYLPGRRRDWMPGDPWHDYLSSRVSVLAKEVDARAILFDGVAPYAGLLQSRRDLPGIPFIWSRRGLWKPGANTRALRATPWFDVVVEPGDLAAQADQGATRRRVETKHVGPVSLLETTAQLDRTKAANELGLDPNRQTVLISLGAGNIDDTSGPTGRAVAAAAARGWQVVVTHAPIREAGSDLPDHVVVLKSVFPLVRYLRALDAVVAAAGYNSVHEFVLAGIPTLLIPNASTATDDQRARAHSVAEQGLALYAAADSAAQIDETVDKLLSGWLPTGPALESPSGAGEIADVVAAACATTSAWRAPRVDMESARFAALRTGRRVTPVSAEARLRAAIGRPGRPGPRERIVVHPYGSTGQGDAIVVTHDVSQVTSAARPIVEHLLADTSEAYARTRAAIAARHYRITGITGDLSVTD